MNSKLSSNNIKNIVLKVAILAALLFVFFFIRFQHFKVIIESPVVQIPIIDSHYFLGWAQQLSDGLGFGPVAFFMSPLYSLFIAFSSIFSENLPVGTLVLQIFLSAITLLLLINYTNRRFGFYPAVFSGLLYALYAPSIYFDGVLLTSTLILFLTAIILSFLDLADNSGKTYKLAAFFFAGMSIGLSALARPSALILLPALLVVYLLKDRKRAVSYIIILTVATFITVLPALIRNYQHGGGFAMTTSSAGINLFIGNHGSANGLYTQAPWLTSAEPIYESGDFIAEAEKRTGKTLSDGQASRYWTGQALGWIVKNPGTWLKLEMTKFAYFFNNVESPNNVSLYGAREHSPLLKNLRFLGFSLVVPLGLLGLFVSRRKKSSWIPIALILSYLAVCLIFFVSSEYRYPIVFVAIAYSSGYFAWLGHQFVGKRESAGLISISVLLLLVLFMNIPWKTMKTIASSRMDYFNWASVSYKKGDLPNASLLYSAVLAKDPTFKDAHLQLGFVFDDLGMHEFADTEYREAGLSPEEVEYVRLTDQIAKPIEETTNLDSVGLEELVSLGRSFNQLGKYDQALLVLSQVLSKDKAHVVALYEYASALESTRRYTQAIEAYRELEILRENDPYIPYRMAWCFYGKGHRGVAYSTMERASKKVDQLADKEIRRKWNSVISKAISQFRNY